MKKLWLEVILRYWQQKMRLKRGCAKMWQKLFINSERKKKVGEKPDEWTKYLDRKYGYLESSEDLYK